MSKNLQSRIFDMYERKKVGRNLVCRECQKGCEAQGLHLYGPLSFWHVGENYEQDPSRVLFVGKTARRTTGTKRRTGIWDVREYAGDFFWEKTWAFWSYTKAILERVYGTPTLGWEKTALTNLMKCNNSGNVDTTTNAMKQSCLGNLKVFQAEVGLLKPKLIVFYTGPSYDTYLDDLFFGDNYIDHKEGFVRNGGKKMRWWDREFTLKGKPVLRFLRTSHPERQGKDGFIRKVSQWIGQAAF
jgi:hypothetical protein